jgi:hypothetical protein
MLYTKKSNKRASLVNLEEKIHCSSIKTHLKRRDGWGRE